MSLMHNFPLQFLTCLVKHFDMLEYTSYKGTKNCAATWELWLKRFASQFNRESSTNPRPPEGNKEIHSNLFINEGVTRLPETGICQQMIYKYNDRFYGRAECVINEIRLSEGKFICLENNFLVIKLKYYLLINFSETTTLRFLIILQKKSHQPSISFCLILFRSRGSWLPTAQSTVLLLLQVFMIRRSEKCAMDHFRHHSFHVQSKT